MKRFLIIPLFIFSLFTFVACDDVVEVCIIDGYCDIDETVDGCPEDCDGDYSYCGDGNCDTLYEDDINCPNDCQLDPCGDGTCDLDETWANCSADCADDCIVDSICDLDWEDATTCPDDCYIDNCDDGTCDADEDLFSCPEDCAVFVCDDYAEWVEILGCEDGAVDVCDVDVDCELNLIDLSDTATEAEVLLIEDCAALLAEDNGSCTETLLDGFNCADELSVEAGFLCSKK
jgi:hypothetical protein